MPSRELSYPLFDADNHLYETQEAFTKYLSKMTEDEQAKVMGGNLARLMGV